MDKIYLQGMLLIMRILLHIVELMAQGPQDYAVSVAPMKKAVDAWASNSAAALSALSEED